MAGAAGVSGDGVPSWSGLIKTSDHVKSVAVLMYRNFYFANFFSGVVGKRPAGNDAATKSRRVN
jgi:hypothetical protein